MTTDLTEADWKVYLDTVREATRRIDPTTGLSIWETGIKHHKEFGGMSHGNAGFLYYHRQLLIWMEKKLQEINPAFAFFYWDSARESSSWTRSVVWNRLGTARKGRPVATGPTANIMFKEANGYLVRDWDFPNSPYAPPTSELLSEIYQGSLKDRSRVFEAYTKPLESFHGAFHVIVGGDKGSMTNPSNAPADPLFWSHHAHIDQIFVRAQLGWTNLGIPKSAFIGGQFHDGKIMRMASRLPGFDSITVGDMVDLAESCVRYAPFGERAPTTSTATSTATGSVNSTVTVTATFEPSATTESSSTVATATATPSSSINLKDLATLSEKWAEQSMSKEDAEQAKKNVEDVLAKVEEKKAQGIAIVPPPTLPRVSVKKSDAMGQSLAKLIIAAAMAAHILM
jgi:hypothetical protein